MNLATPLSSGTSLCPAVRCWRLIHNGDRIISYEEGSGALATTRTLFCSTKEECDAEIARLDLQAPAGPRRLTKYAFWSRLTSAEQVAMHASADPVIKTFLFNLSLVDFVDLDLPDIAAAKAYATSSNAFSPARADAIFD